MGKSNFCDDFKSDAVRQTTERGYPVTGGYSIGKTPGHQPASHDVHGQIASILAAMEAAAILEKGFEALRRDYLEKLYAGELDTEQKQKKLLDAYAEELSVLREALCLVLVH